MKKLFIIGGIILVLLTSCFGVYVYYSYQQKEKIDNYIELLDKKSIESDEKISKKLNEMVILYQELTLKSENVFNEASIYSDYNNAKTLLTERSKTYQQLKEELVKLDEENVKDIFKKEYSNHLNYVAYKYQKTKFYKGVEELEQKILNEETRSINLLTYVDYLIANQSEVKYFDSILYYEKEEIGNQLNKYKEDFNLNTVIDKGTLSYTTANIPILMYHGVSDNVWGISSLFVSPSDFDMQMKYISENGYTPIFMHEIEHLDPSITKPIVITFDDGNYDLYTEAFPILKKYNIKATIFIISGFGDGVYSMTLAQAKELSDSGLISLQSHTVTHKQLATLSLDEIERELRDSKATLEQLTGKTVHTIAYPVGSYDRRVIEIAKKYYKYGLLAGGGTAYINQNMKYFEIKRVGIYREDSFAKFKAACATSSR